MKSITVLLFTLIFLSLSLAFSDYQNREFMNIEKAQKKWGKKTFVASKFKSGDEKVRASMVGDLIKSKTYIGKPLKKVREDLGEPTGFYENDGISAYILTPETSSKTERKKDVWQVIFLPSKDWKTVKEVKIHKNCCS